MLSYIMSIVLSIDRHIVSDCQAYQKAYRQISSD